MSLSLTKQILLAILIGSFLGILLGPLASVFSPIASAFVMFIQMVILLYTARESKIGNF